MNELETIFSDKKYCFSEIGKARQLFSDRANMTVQKVEAMGKALGLMYLYCPEDIEDLVVATMTELAMRSSHLGVVLGQPQERSLNVGVTNER
jgi:hypothetical protein